MQSLAAFLAELKRRRVFRVAIVYAGVAFIIIQIIDGAFDYLRIPEWVGTTIIVLLLIGFPIAVALAWAFDITDKGIVRTRGKAQAPATSRRPILTNWTLGIVAALAIIVAVWAFLREPSPRTAAITSIAVLPLENLMNDPEQDYFVDGMHEALTVELSKVSALRVIGRRSTMSYKANPKPVPEIAEELDVDAVIEGSVSRDGDLVRITAQLVATRPERHLWANDYDRDLTDILSLQKTIARAIANEIGLALTPEEEVYLASAPQVNPEAYDLYLQGSYIIGQQNPETITRAVDYLEQAVAIDPNFAQAYAGLVAGYFSLDWLAVISSREARSKARAAIERALELDDTLPYTQIYLGFYLYMYEWDWTGAERAFKRAIELAPNLVQAHLEYGLYLGKMARLDEALVEMQRVKELDPLLIFGDYGFGEVYLYNRQYEKAIEHLKRVLEPDPGNFTARVLLASAYVANSMYAEALEEYENLGSRPGILLTNYAMGRETEALAYFDSLKATGEPLESNFVIVAAWYSSVGDKEVALNLLEKAYQERSWDIWVMLTNPEFDFLRAEPRFKALLEKLGLTEVFDEYGQRIR